MKLSWNTFFKLTDPFFKHSDRYLQFKSKKIPDEKISKGLSVSCDSTLAPKKYVVQTYNDIDFFKLKTNLGIFEIKLITYKNRGKVYYTVYSVSMNIQFTIDEDTFKLLFKNEEVLVDEKFKTTYLKPQSESKKL